MRIKRSSSSRSNANSWHIRIAAILFATSFAVIIFLWIGGVIHFLSNSNENDSFIRKGADMTSSASSVEMRGDATITNAAAANEKIADNILSLNLYDISPPITIRIAVYKEQCPKAYEFLSFMVHNQATECSPCTIYRGEPVPTYWGSNDYPDRYFDGGRWGPPYALVQGGFVNSKFNKVQQDNHRPKILQRGMVAWAGGSSIHFFVALADHPEWGDFHTVWGHVLPEDMTLVDALVKDYPLTVMKKSNPVVTNFVTPMHFHLAWE